MITYIIHTKPRISDDGVLHYLVSRVSDRFKGNENCKHIYRVACFCDLTKIGEKWNVHCDGCDLRFSSLDECKRFIDEHDGYNWTPQGGYVRDDVEFVESDTNYDEIPNFVYRGKILPYKICPLKS